MDKKIMAVKIQLQTAAVDGFVSTWNTEQVHFQGLLKIFHTELICLEI